MENKINIFTYLDRFSDSYIGIIGYLTDKNAFDFNDDAIEIIVPESAFKRFIDKERIPLKHLNINDNKVSFKYRNINFKIISK